MSTVRTRGNGSRNDRGPVADQSDRPGAGLCCWCRPGAALMVTTTDSAMAGRVTQVLVLIPLPWSEPSPCRPGGFVRRRAPPADAAGLPE
jgi:hypothetical protein